MLTSMSSPVVSPEIHLGECGCGHPFADLDVEIGILDVAQEFCRRKQAAFRMPPADQSFGTDQFFRAQVDLGLVVTVQTDRVPARGGCFSGIRAGRGRVDPVRDHKYGSGFCPIAWLHTWPDRHGAAECPDLRHPADRY